MNIKISYILLGIISIIIITVGLILYAGDNAESIPKSRSAKVDYEKLDDVIFNVKTNQAFIGDLIKTTNANGTVRPVNEIDVASNISSTVEKINIYEGKRVRKGDLLIKLDDREYKINLDEAEDKLIEAKVEYYFLTKDSPVVKDVDGEAAVIENEIEQLEGEYQRGIISDDRFQEVKDSLDLKLIFSGGRKEELILNKSGINRAKNQKERALLNIEHTNLIAPFSGIIGDFNLSVGQRISSGETLFKLIDDSELLIDVGILESEIPSIELGNFAEIELSALPGEKFEGSVIYISPFVDAETKTCKVTIKLENPTKKIKPGMFASVKLQTAVLKDKLLVDKDALLVRDRRSLVFTVQDSLAKWKYVDISDENDKYLVIESGIAEGDKVIVQGQYTLAHDAKVRVIE